MGSLAGGQNASLVENIEDWRLSSAEEEYNVVRIKVGGILVRYVANTHSIQMTVEGTLPLVSVQTLLSDLRAKNGEAGECSL